MISIIITIVVIIITAIIIVMIIIIIIIIVCRLRLPSRGLGTDLLQTITRGLGTDLWIYEAAANATIWVVWRLEWNG